MRSAFATLLAIGVTSLAASAQAPNAGTYSPEKYEIRESRNHKVKMRDGIALSVDLYRPASEGKFPVILSHTPYDNNSSWMAKRARWFARRGYIVALSDVRGRYDSDGEFDPFDKKHKTDGYDLVEWLARQPWSTGNVGMMGVSYLGWTQWWTATQAPPSLKAIVPEVAPPDQFANCPYQQGILVSWMMDWGALMAGRTAQRISDAAYGGFAATREKDYFHLPYAELNDLRGAVGAPWFATWIRDNLSTSSYWKDIAYQTREHYQRITVPSLNITGWFDADFPGAPMNYRGMKRHGATAAARRPALIIGPWAHSYNAGPQLAGIDYGPQSVIDADGYVCRWFDHFLKGEKNGVEKDPPVHVFVMGRNQWHAAKDWPLPGTRPTKYFLHGQGKANSLSGDGTISLAPPADEPHDSYVYDPAQPTPSPFTGGHVDGAVDARKSADRADVLVYTTPPLAEEVEVTGMVEAKLFAATSARDTDWMMRLVDVRPDGTAALMCDGVIRARCRDPQNAGAFTSERLSTIEPDKVYEYTIHFWRGTGNLFKKGHRIRVEISSSYFPYYLRNLNTGDDNVGLATKTVVARQKVYHTKEFPSHVVLPVIPARQR